VKAYIRARSRRQVLIFFGIGYVILALMAMFPPLYLATSGIRTPVLGMPFTLFYWALNGVLVFVLILGLNVVERIRGELDPEPAVKDEGTAG
jgi:hypothetical protein